MRNSIDIHRNIIIYLIQQFMGWIIHVLISIIKPISPLILCKKIEELESNPLFINVIGLTILNGLGGVLVLLTNIKLANLLGASVFGIYSYYIAVGEAGANFVRYGRHKTMTRDLIQQPHLFDSLITNTFTLGLINIVLFVFFIVLLSKQLEIELSCSAFCLILAPCIGCVDFQPVYESFKLISWHATYFLIQKVVFFAGIWLGIISLCKPSLQYISIILFLSWLIILIIQYWEIIINLGIKFKDKVSIQTIWGLYKSNFLISLSCLTGVAFGPIIQMVLNKYTSSSAVGIYAAGMQIFLLCQFLFNQVARVGNPLMAEAGRTECNNIVRRTLVKKYTFIMLGSALPFLLPLVVFPNWIVSKFFSEEYAELVELLPWFGIYLVGLSIGIVFTQFLISMRHDRLYFTIYVASAFVTVASAFILIPMFGVMGAVISLCVPHTIGCFFYFLFSLKYL